MITSGVTVSASDPTSRTASRVEVSGSRSMTVVMAPMPMATAGTRTMPGRCDPATPSAPPMNIAGKIGPPRNDDNEAE